MVFDLLSLGSKLRVWSSASPFHPPVVLRFQRVPMAASGGDGKSVQRDVHHVAFVGAWWLEVVVSQWPAGQRLTRMHGGEAPEVTRRRPPMETREWW